jgi:hypothetical protein
MTPSAATYGFPAAPAAARPLYLRTRARTDISGSSSSGRDALADLGVLQPEGRITITRQSPDDVGFREIFVSVDGQPLGMLRHGDTLTTELPAGPHRIRAHNTLFWKTHDIVLRPAEHVRFSAINRAGWGTFGMLFILGAMPVYLTFERVPSDRLTPSVRRE